MNVKSVEKNDNGKLTFTVEVPGAAFEAALNKAYLKAKKDVFVAGFRKGKAPRMVIEGMYGKDVFHEDAVNEIAPDAYDAAMTDDMPKTVGYPTITKYVVNDDKSAVLDFSVSLYPEATLGQYKGLEVYKENADVTDAEISEQLEEARKKGGRIVTADRAVKNGDTANIDFDGYKDGVRFDGGKSEGYDLAIGSGSFVPGFEEQLIGMSAGEEKDIDITFPENYHADLAGAAVVFKVKINEVRETQLPELDDEFAKDVSEFETLKAYKESIKENLAETKNAEVTNAFRSRVLTKAVEGMTVTVPDEMVDAQVDTVMKEYAQNCMMQGMEFEKYLASMGMNLQSFRSVVRPGAENDVKIEILLETIAKAEKISVSEEDIEAEYQKIAESYKMELDKVKTAVDASVLSKDLLLKKTAEFVCDSAVATDKPEEEPSEEKKPTKKSAAKKTEDGEEKKPAAKKTAKKTEEVAGEEKPAEKKTTTKKAATQKAEPKTEGDEKKPAAKKTTKKSEAAE